MPVSRFRRLRMKATNNIIIKQEPPTGIELVTFRVWGESRVTIYKDALNYNNIEQYSYIENRTVCHVVTVNTGYQLYGNWKLQLLYITGFRFRMIKEDYT